MSITNSDETIVSINLENPPSNINITDTTNDNSDIKCITGCVTICYSILVIPIIICDLYFGFNDKSCVNEIPTNININMHEYLIVSAFILLGILITLPIYIYVVFNNNSFCTTMFTMLYFVIGLFNFAWNIVGAVIFWGNIYPNGHCDNSVSNYIFTILIIKFIFMLSIVKNNKKSN